MDVNSNCKILSVQQQFVIASYVQTVIPHWSLIYKDSIQLFFFSQHPPI